MNLLRLAAVASRVGPARQIGSCGTAGFSRSAAVKAWSRRMRITPFRSSSRLRERWGSAASAVDWRMGNGMFVRPDVVHSYNGNGAVGAMLFVDPESLEGVWLRSSLREEITLVPRRGCCPVPASCAGSSSSRLRASRSPRSSSTACTRCVLVRRRAGGWTHG